MRSTAKSSDAFHPRGFSTPVIRLAAWRETPGKSFRLLRQQTHLSDRISRQRGEWVWVYRKDGTYKYGTGTHPLPFQRSRVMEGRKERITKIVGNYFFSFCHVKTLKNRGNRCRFFFNVSRENFTEKQVFRKLLTKGFFGEISCTAFFCLIISPSGLSPVISVSLHLAKKICYLASIG